MGLAAAKNKRKLGTDPNNTKWSRNETTFGQKILRAQGWQPGDFLGAKDAAHAVHHTEASSSHIKVTLKDDTLGLGAKRNNGDECTGLFDFQHLLGRLNGKSEDVLEAEKQKRENHLRNHYLEQKIGTIRFVRGGWLVGDVVKEKVTEEDGVPQSDAVDQQVETTTPSDDTSSVEEPTERKSKKRKADADSDDDEEEKEEKKDKKSKKRKTDTEAETDSGSSRLKKKEKKDKKEKKGKKEKKDKKDKKKSKKSSSDSSDEDRSSDDVESSAAETKKSKTDKKKDKKEKKKEKKEKKRKEKGSSDSSSESEDSKSKEKKKKKKNKDGSETVTSSGTSTPTVTTSTRFLARQRFIAQKKAAFTDSAALNQIFMIKI